jgi:hypothetical protein
LSSHERGRALHSDLAGSIIGRKEAIMTHSQFTYDHYRYILGSGLENEYHFVSYLALDEYRKKVERLCVLRHDCDNDLMAAVAMARIEKEMDVQATYFIMLRSALYNVLSIPCKEFVQEIINLGHWIGCHFDERYYTQLNLRQIAAQVDQERRLLSREFKTPVKVVSFHQPSRRVLNNTLRINSFNTYGQKDMKGVHYLSDSNMTWREECPCEVFQVRRYTHLHLLIHPEWWTERKMDVRRKWNSMLRNNFEFMQSSLLERESTYCQPQNLTFYRERGGMR